MSERSVHIIMYMACAANVTTPVKAGVFTFHLAANPTILSTKIATLCYFIASGLVIAKTNLVTVCSFL